MPLFADLTPYLAPLQKLNVEELLLPVLAQLAVIIVVARLAGILFRAIGQPAVVGEIIGGILLGPSVFGALFPQTFHALFQPELPGVDPALVSAAFPKVFDVLAQLGLILLLFLIGLEFDFGHLRTTSRSAAAISIVGMVIPFGLGLVLSPPIHAYLEPHPTQGPVDRFGMSLFLGTALSITAIPVLGRMLIELGLNRTRLAGVTITAAAIGDAVGWILLATVAALSRSAYDPWQTLQMAGLTVLFALGMRYLVRPVLVAYFRWSLAHSRGHLSLNAMAVLLVSVILAAIATNRIGIFAIFGAFLLGAVLSDQHQLREAVSGRMRDFITSFFLPVFFTYTGLRTDIGALTSGTAWTICGVVVLAALVGKMAGCSLTSRLCGFAGRESMLIGVLMNTRGLMELVVINVGYELGVIPKSLFSMLVVMAIVTTVMTTPLVLRLARGTELEEPLVRTGFLRRIQEKEPPDPAALVERVGG